MKLVLIAAAFAACAEPKAPAPPETAADIYAHMLDRYAHAETYADHGAVTVTATAAGKTESDHFTFATQYLAGDRLRIAIEVEPGKTIELWSDKVHTYYKAFFNEDITDYGVEREAALHATSGITGGLMTEVPLALLGHHARADAIQLTATTPETWQLHVTDHGDQLDVFVDRKTSLLRRVVRVRQYPSTPSKPVPVELKTAIDYTGSIGDKLAIAPLALDRPVVPDGPPAWLGIMSDPTAVVLQVIPSSPANAAGIQVGDQVVSIAGHPVQTNKDVVSNAHQLRAEQQAVVVVKRNGTTVPITVVPKPRPDVEQLQAKFIGTMAPPFALPSVDGKTTIDLKALRGHVVVVDFWATWCKPCAITTPHMERLAASFPELRVIGISDEDQPDLAAFLAKHPVGYAQAVDAGDKASRDYLIQGLPTVYVIDKAGTIQYTAVGVPDFDTLDGAIKKLL